MTAPGRSPLRLGLLLAASVCALLAALLAVLPAVAVGLLTLLDTSFGSVVAVARALLEPFFWSGLSGPGLVGLGMNGAGLAGRGSGGLAAGMPPMQPGASLGTLRVQALLSHPGLAAAWSLASAGLCALGLTLAWEPRARWLAPASAWVLAGLCGGPLVFLLLAPAIGLRLLAGTLR